MRLARKTGGAAADSPVPPGGRSPAAVLVSIIVFALVLSAVWLPELGHWHATSERLSESAVSMARHAPADSLLDEISGMSLRGVPVNAEQTVAAAQAALTGVLQLPGYPATRFTLPFAAQDLERGSPHWQLMLASLATADVLLDGYRATHDERMYQQARSIIEAFGRYESAQWMDRGLMWNDHAISARIPVLIKFWLEYRRLKRVDPALEQLLLGWVARSANLLGKSDFYAWRTSHGIISDLALLQIAAAFPALPESARARQVATERFARHLDYWIGRDGVTLLHSAGYHAGSLYHFSLGLRLFTLNGLSIPPAWWQRHDAAVEHLARLRRPDGSLPMFGDTTSAAVDAAPMLTAPDASTGAARPLFARDLTSQALRSGLYPGSGYSIWWDVDCPGPPPIPASCGAMAQTVMTWAYQPGLGHKLADELSVLIWARGRTWLTNTGYWPYGAQGRDAAESWPASNAPHLDGEDKLSSRESRPLRSASTDGLRFIEVERSGPDGLRVRRQLVHLPGAASWLVVDASTDASARSVVSNWTFHPNLELKRLPGIGQLLLQAPGNRPAMRWRQLNPAAGALELRRASLAPFGGWVVGDRTAEPAHTIVTRQPSQGGWSMVSLSIADGTPTASLGANTPAAQWQDAENWRAEIDTSAGSVTLAREGGQLSWSTASKPPLVVLLVPVNVPAIYRQDVEAAMRSAAQDFRKFPQIVTYRVKVTYALIAAFIAQELLLLAMASWGRTWALRLRAATWAGWALGGLWISQAYLSVA